jgi:DNA-directed RNA polymerase
MLMRDAALAKATNVFSGDQPRDIYTEVANIVKERMFETPKKNKVLTDAPEVETLNVISFLRRFPDLVDRNMGKSVVMIIPYGAGKEKYQQEIAKILINKIAPKKSRAKHGDVSTSRHVDEILGFFRGNTDVPLEQPAVAVRRWIRHHVSSHLAAHFREAVSVHFPAIDTFKNRLGKAIKPLTKAGIPVMWVAPSGMPIIQDDFTPLEFPGVEVSFPGFRKAFTHKELSEEIAPKQQAQGILPNFIHSMDAAHLVKTVNLARERGIHSISTVHDSYASHACHVDLLGKCIREAFCLLYPNDVDRLMAFEDWCSALIGATPVHDADPYSPTEQVLLRLAEAWSKSDGKSQEQTGLDHPFAKVGHRIASSGHLGLTESGLEALTTQGWPAAGPNDDQGQQTQSGVEDWAEQIRQSAYFFS